MSVLLWTKMRTPIGIIRLVGDENGALRRIDFHAGCSEPEPGWKESRPPLAEAIRQLEEYFAVRRTAFDLALAPEGTPFQRETWRQLLAIPYGETISYGELARRMGKPGASRAVGAANGANPIPIVIPCHRVIGSNGDLTGFGGGLQTKRELLMLEGAMPVRLSAQRGVRREDEGLPRRDRSGPGRRQARVRCDDADDEDRHRCDRGGVPRLRSHLRRVHLGSTKGTCRAEPNALGPEPAVFHRGENTVARAREAR